MFHGIIGAIFLFLLLRFVLPLKGSFRRKAALSLLLLVLSQQHLVNRLFFGTLASPELPSGVIALQGAMFSTFLLLAVGVLLRDVFGLIARLDFRPGRPLAASGRLALGLFLMAAVLSVGGVGQALRVPEMRTVEISLKDLPVELEGFRIAHLSDIHASSLLREEWVQAVVAATNALEPDLILLTGDIIDGTSENRAADVSPFRDLQARYGVFGIAGNHEYYSGFHDWMRVYHTLGLRMLLNGHAVITHKGAALVIAGTTDKVALRFGLPAPDTKAALAGAPEGATTILMAHQPGSARENAAEGVQLQLSGHTHGGQILGLRLVSQYVNKGFISGLYDVGGMSLYVSNGAGLRGGFPVRLGIPSEITEIILRRAAS